MSTKATVVAQDANKDKTEGKRSICYSSIVFLAVTLIQLNCTLPVATFGIVFGKFMATLGDETTGTSMANGIYNVVYAFTGLAATVLLNKLSCRDVGLLGGAVATIGAFSLYFVDGRTLFMICFGVLEGFGYGLLTPASYTAFNNYFDPKLLSVCMSSALALTIGLVMLGPPLATTAMETLGYRGTLLCHGAITFLNIPASLALYRANNNYKQVPQDDDGENGIKTGDTANKIPPHQQMTSLTSVYMISREQIEKQGGFWKSIFSLLGSLKYLNIAFGLSLGYTSDMFFISIIPLLLSNAEFGVSDIALSMTIFFGSDLVSRILLSIISTVRTPNSRQIVLYGCLFSFIFRIVFIYCWSFIWKIASLATLGFLRCLIQTCLPLVISQEYPELFATGFSLYMVICGIVSITVTFLIGVLKTLTNSDTVVCHLLTSCYAVCVISWVVEIIVEKGRKPKHVTKKISAI